MPGKTCACLKLHPSHVRSIAGVTLIEAMIALGIGTLGVMAITSSMLQMGRANRNLDIKTEAQNLKNASLLVLTAPSGCVLNLRDPADPLLPLEIPQTVLDNVSDSRRNTVPLRVNLTPIKWNPTTSAYERVEDNPLMSMWTPPSGVQAYGQVAQYGKLRIRDYRVRVTDNLGSGSYLGKVEITAMRNVRDLSGPDRPIVRGGHSYGTDDIPIEIPIRVAVDATNRITDCTVSASGGAMGGTDEKTLCDMLGGTYDDKKSPRCQLEERLDETLDYTGSGNWVQHWMNVRFYTDGTRVPGSSKPAFYAWDPEWGSQIGRLEKRIVLTNYKDDGASSYVGSMTFQGSDGAAIVEFCIPKVDPRRVYILERIRHKEGTRYAGSGADRRFRVCMDDGHGNGPGKILVTGRHDPGASRDCREYNLRNEFVPATCDRPNCS